LTNRLGVSSANVDVSQGNDEAQSHGDLTLRAPRKIKHPSAACGAVIEGLGDSGRESCAVSIKLLQWVFQSEKIPEA
jgi:hypothetical protein